MKYRFKCKKRHSNLHSRSTTIYNIKVDHSKKAQSAMDMTMTYTIALVVLFVVAVGMWYAGFLSPENYLSDRAEIGEGLLIRGMSANASQITLVVYNGAGRTLRNLQIELAQCTNSGEAMSTPTTLGEGQSAKVVINCERDTEEKTFKSDMTVTYTTKTAGTDVSHSTEGYLRMSTKAEDASSSAISIAFVSPTDTSGTTLYRNYIQVKVEASSANLSYIWITLAGTTIAVNAQGNTSGTLLHNFTDLEYGTYTFNATANDTLGNQQSTETRTITLSENAPPSFTNLQNLTTFDNETVSYDFNADDSDGISCFSVNESTFIINCSGYFTNSSPLEVRMYYINISVNDTYSTTTSALLTVNSSSSNPPTISYVTPTETHGSSIYNREIRVNLSVNASDIASIYIRLTNSTGGVVNTISSTTNPLYYKFTSSNTDNLQPGIYYFIANVSDSLGRINQTSQRTVTLIDNESPEFVNAPNTLNFYDNESISYQFTAEDNFETISCYWINSTPGFSLGCNGIITNSTQLTEKIYSLNLSVNDTSGNKNSKVVNVNVSAGNLPTIEFVSPTEANETSAYRSYIPVNVTTTGVSITSIKIKLSNLTNVVSTQTNTTPSTFFYNFTNLPRTNYTIYANVTDSRGKIAETETRVIYLGDISAPSFGNLQNLTFLENQSVSFTFNATDDGTVACFSVNDTSRFNITCGGAFANKTPMNITTYDVNLSVNDTFGNRNSAVFKVTVNAIPMPNISFVNPTITSGTNQTWNHFAANVSANDSFSGIRNITLRLYNSSGGVINTTTVNASNVYVNYTLLANSVYYINATAYNNGSKNSSTETRNVTINASIIAFVAPTSVSGNVVNVSSYAANVSMNTTTIKQFKWNWNGTNYTLFNSSVVLKMNLDNVAALGESSVKAVDVSQYGNNGTISGATWTSSGKYGGAYRFDGVNDYISLPTLPTFSGGYSIALWFNYFDSAIGYPSLLVAENSLGGGLNIADGSMTIQTNGASGNPTAGSTTIIQTNTWYHAVMTVSGNNGVANLYVNGVKESNVSSFDYVSSPQWAIGINPVANRPFNGTIDDVMIFNRALSAAEVQQLYYSNLYKYDTDKWAFYVNESNQTNGAYTYYAFVNDAANNNVSTEQRTLTVNYTTPVTIGFVSPTLGTGSTENQSSYAANVSINTSSLVEFRWNWNGTNYTLYNDSLVLMYNFDNVGAIGEVENSVVKDVSSNGNNGNVSGATWTADGKYNGAYGFDGDDKIDSPNDPMFDFDNNDFSIFTWIYSTVSAQSALIAKSTGDHYGWLFLQNSLGLQFLQGNSYDWGILTVSTDDVLTLNEWFHVGVVQTDSQLNFYVNGAAISMNYNGRSEGGSVIGSDTYVTIGGTSWGLPFTGTMDDVFIINRSLTANEVKQLYYSNLYKYDTDKWGFYVNESSQANGAYTYSAYAKDGADNEANTEQRTVTINRSSVLSIEYVDPTLGSESVVNVSSYAANVSINTSDGITEFKWEWNGTNYTLYDNSLVLLYNLDSVAVLGEDSSTVKDASLSGNNGTVYNGAAVTTGKYSGAFSFDGIAKDGSQGYISCGTADGSLSITTDTITLSAWVYYTGVADDNLGWILGKMGSADGAYGMWIATSSGTNYLAFSANSGSGWGDSVGDISVSANAWHHVAVTYDGNNVNYYVDSVSGTPVARTGSIVSAGNSVKIGWEQGWNSQAFKGNIDEVRIYNRTLSTSEVKQLYYSNLYKYDTDKWGFYVNESGQANGAYTYSAYVKDSIDAEDNTAQRSVTINMTPLVMSFVDPTPANGTTQENRSVLFNVSLDQNVTGCTLTVYLSGLVATGGTITTDATYTYHTFTSSDTFSTTSAGNATIYAWGGGGAGGTVGGWSYGAPGGAGGAASGRWHATSGSYPVVVGGGGIVNYYGYVTGGGGSASNNNEDNRYSGSGGGYSGIFTSSVAQENAILIAGGGGGGSSSRAGEGNAGGAGGGSEGQVGYSIYDGKSSYGGNPGTQSGAGANPSTDCYNGGGEQNALQGGSPYCNSYGGGGGGGYWGGSAGGYSESNTMGGGGGGSGYYNPSLISSGVLTAGSGTTPGDSGNAYRAGTYGNAGSVAGDGTQGVLIVRYNTPAINNYEMTVHNANANTWAEYSVADLADSVYEYNVSCTSLLETTNITDTRSLEIYNPPPVLGVTLTDPLSDVNVEFGGSFNVTANVTCTVADCGDVIVTLDPWNGCYHYNGYYWYKGEYGQSCNTVCSTHGGVVSAGCTEADSGSCEVCNSFYPANPCSTQMSGEGATYSPWYGCSSQGIYASNCDTYDANVQRFCACNTDCGVTKSGTVSTTPGATPFYTTSDNPVTITLNEDESQLITWTVIATGESPSITTYPFFAYANISSDQTISSVSSTFNTIISFPTISVSQVNPASSPRVDKNEFFNYSVDVTCTSGNCSDIDVYLDPECVESQGYHWYQGGFGQNCNAVCSSHGAAVESCTYPDTSDCYVCLQFNPGASCTALSGGEGPTYVNMWWWYVGCSYSGAYAWDCSMSESNTMRICPCNDNCTTAKGGLVSTTPGTTPFYTTNDNPKRITLSEGQTQQVTWMVNATGELNNLYKFYAYANLTSMASISALGSSIFVNISEAFSITSPTNSTYPLETFFNITLNTFEATECNYTMDSVINNTMTLLSSTSFTAVNSSMVDGGHEVYFTCLSTTGSIKISSTVYFTIDTFAPQIYFTDPTPPASGSAANVLPVNISIYNSSDLSTFTYNWEGTSYVIYNNSLALMMNFDKVSAIGDDDSTSKDISNYGNNGTINGATWTSDGKLDGAFDFNSGTGYISHPTSGLSSTSGTVMGWVYPTSNTWGFWQTHDEDGIDWTDWISMFAHEGGGFYFRMGDGGGCCNNDLVFTTVDYIPQNTWSFLSFTWGDGNMYVYVNGTQIATRGATFQGTMNAGARIGQSYNYRMQGKIDEFKIYSRALSADEILQYYNSTLKLSKYDTDKWQFYAPYRYLTEETYSFSATATDLPGNSNSTETRDVVYYIGPIITSVSPIHNMHYNYLDFFFNITLDKAGDWCGYTLNDAVENVTMDKLSDTEYTNISTQVDGKYNVTYYCNDSRNVNVSSNKITFTIDTIPPLIYFTNPTVEDSSTLINSIPINISIDDVSKMGAFKFNWNGTNYSLYDENLVLLMNFDKVSSIGENDTVAMDVSRSNFTGTVHGATWTANGKYDGAYSFDGSDDYIATGITSNLQVFSLIAWIKPTDTGSYQILGKDTNTKRGWTIWIGSGTLGLEVNGGEGYSLSASGIATGVWTFVAITTDGTINTLYINGTQVGQSSHALAENAGAQFSIGRRDYPGAEAYYKGSVDSVMLYNTTLTADEIRKIYYSSLYMYDYDKWQFFINLTNQTESAYSFNGWVQDLAGNINATETREITYIVAPNITVLAPTVNYSFLTPTPDFNISLDKAGDWCGYSLNGTANVTMTKVNDTFFTKTVAISDTRSINVTFFCNDSRLLNSTKGPINFSVDTVVPYINFVPPTTDNNTGRIASGAPINISINNTADMGIFKLNWNGTNYSLYDGDVLLMTNFDNVSALGENNTIVKDVSRYKQNITVNGPTWISSGKYGGAYSFDGVNDVMTFVTYPEGVVSISFWMKASSTKDGGIIISGTDAWNSGAWNWGAWTINTGANFYLHSSGSCNYNTGALPIGVWHHYVVVRNNGSSAVYYIDGAKVGTSCSASSDTSGNKILRFGKAGNYFNGSLDEIYLYNRSLTANEVKQLYYSNLKMYDTEKWQFYTNESNMVEGDYSYYGWVSDIAGNSNMTETRYLGYLENASMTVTVTSTSRSDNNISINVTANSFNISWCGYSLNGTANVSLTINNNRTANATSWNTADGLNYFYVTCIGTQVGTPIYLTSNNSMSVGSLTFNFNNLTGEGVVGNGRQFTGGSDTYTLGAGNVTNLTSGGMCFWVKPTSDNTDVYFYSQQGNSPYYTDLDIFTDGSGKLVARIGGSDTTYTSHCSHAYVSSNFVVPLSQWTHVCFLWNTSGSWLYANGNVVASGTEFNSIMKIKPNSLNGYFGKNTGGTSNSLTGYMDEIIVDFNLKTSEQIFNIYSSQKPTPVNCTGITCPSYCIGNTSYVNGTCSNGQCSYNASPCTAGICASGLCFPASPSCTWTSATQSRQCGSGAISIAVNFGTGSYQNCVNYCKTVPGATCAGAYATWHGGGTCNCMVNHTVGTHPWSDVYAGWCA